MNTVLAGGGIAVTGGGNGIETAPTRAVAGEMGDRIIAGRVA